ncbi:serine hydrolase domain-containing protein [Bacteroidota bacterium]
MKINKINSIQNKFTILHFTFLILFTLLTANHQTKSSDKNNPESSDPFLNYSTPEEQGLDSELLADMLEKIKLEDLKVRSVIIIRNGHLVLESYVHPYTKDVLHDVKSVSKSIISSVVGLALKENIIESLEQKVSDFLPEYFQDEDSIKRNIKLSHLLSMSSGLSIDENGSIMNEIMTKEDWVEETFKQPIVSSPGEEFSYCTFLTHAMSLVLSKASRTGLLELTHKHLFNNLGIKEVYWEKGPHGYYFGGDKLWLTPRAMAKFGYLYLNNGMWSNNQILPQEWVEASTKNQFKEFPDSSYIGYGYGWWLGKNGSYYARGAGGQIISVYPERDMVVVFTGADSYVWQNLTNEFILPAVNETGLLPPNHDAKLRIKNMIGELELPEPISLQPVPEIVKKISDKKFILENNDLGFSEITFSFNEPDVFSIVIKYEDKILDLLAGLDGIYRVNKEVKWGIKPDNNIIALRGTWLNETKLFLDFHEVGEPFYFEVELEFSSDNISALFTWQPFGWKFHVVGTPK